MKRFGLAVFVVLLGIGMLAPGGNVWARAGDALSEDMIVSAAGQGDALLGGVYKASLTDNENFVTYFTIVNTSDDYVLIHVRLRSGKYSIEVWDKQFCLTPKDVIWFELEMDAYGETYIFWEGSPDHDPLKTNLLTDVAFAPDDPIETSVGYIEVFGIGSGPTACTGTNDVDNVLMGNVMMGDFSTGVYMAYKMTAIRNFRLEGKVHRDGSTAGYIDKTKSVYTDSDWATSYGPTWNDGDDNNGSGIIGDANSNFSLDDVENALAKTLVKSTYFNGGWEKPSPVYFHTYTGLWITFPTKYLHYFWGTWPYGNPGQAYAARLGMATAPNGINFDAFVYNLAEDKWIKPPSPAWYIPPLPWEVNFIPIGDLSQAFFADQFLVYLGYQDYGWPFNAPAEGTPAYYAGWTGLFDFELVDLGLRTVPVRGYCDYIPPLALTVDYETWNYDHARAFEPQWDLVVGDVTAPSCD